MKDKKVLIVIILVISLSLIGTILGVVDTVKKYSNDNMIPGEYGLGYLFGEGTDATSVVVNDIGRFKPFEFNGENFGNVVALDLTIPYDNDHDFYYYLFSDAKDIKYWVYDEESKKIDIEKVTYVRDKYNDKVIVILEIPEDLMNAKWVRVFNLNQDRGLYDKESVCFKINIPVN